MKRLMLILACASFVFSCTTQENKKADVPSAAKTAFTAMFQNARKVEWSIEKPGEFEAEFVLNGVKSSAVYDSKGNLVETESEIKENELPQAVETTLAKDFTGYKLDEFEKTTDAKGNVTYELEAAKDKAVFELVFNSNGTLTSKQEKKKGNGNKD